MNSSINKNVTSQKYKIKNLNNNLELFKIRINSLKHKFKFIDKVNLKRKTILQMFIKINLNRIKFKHYLNKLEFLKTIIKCNFLILNN